MPLDFPDSPATNATYTYGGVTWKYDGVKWRLLATTPVVSLVTSLPTSPTDGQEVYYQASGDMETNGIVWHLRYRSAGGTYKWEYLGGPPLSKEFPGNNQNPYTQTFADVNTPASTFDVPRAGTYVVSLGASMFINSGVSLARIRLSYKVGTAIADVGDGIYLDVPRNTHMANHYRDRVKTFSSPTTLTLQFRCEEAGIAAYVQHPYLAVTPIRIS